MSEKEKSFSTSLFYISYYPIVHICIKRGIEREREGERGGQRERERERERERDCSELLFLFFYFLFREHIYKVLRERVLSFFFIF